MKEKYSIHLKLVGAISIFLLFIGIVAGSIVINTSTEKILFLKKEYATVITKTLSETLVYQILFLDSSITQELLLKIIQNEDIEFACIINPEGDFHAHTFTPYPPDSIINNIDINKEMKVINDPYFGTILLDVQPLYNGDLGHLVIGYKIVSLMPLWIKLTLSLIFTLIIMFFVLTRILSKTVTRPLDRIINEISILDENGIPRNYVTLNSSREIGLLSKTINRMIKQIKKSREDLTQHKENLESLVSVRTQELEDSLKNLKITQEQLIEREKMSSLGELVAGVSHEINTPVGIGVTAASHLESISQGFVEQYNDNKISKTDFDNFIIEIKDSSKIILTNMKRAASLINSFKQVAVDQSSDEIRNFELIEYINETLLSLKSRFRNNSHKVFVSSLERIYVETFPGAISQILTNLIMNSLIHGFTDTDNGIIKISVNNVDGFIELTYEDNGVGMNDETLKKVYDPFYTTKRGSGGSGLGMNIVYNLIISSLKGRIEAESALGKGVRFFIQFPLKIM